MPDLFAPSLSGPERSPAPEATPDSPGDRRPGAVDGLDPIVTASLDGVWQNGLAALYGPAWQDAGARLAQAFAAERGAAYARLAQEPGAFGAVTGDREQAEQVAGALWAREQVLAEARGEPLPPTDHTTAERHSSAVPPEGPTPEVDPPRRLQPGENVEFGDPSVRSVPAGARTRPNGGAAVPAGSPYLPLGVSVRGLVAVDRVGAVDGRQVAEVTVRAYSTASTNGHGRVHNVLTGGRLVEVTPDGRSGREIPFTLRPDPRGVVLPDSPGGSREFGMATLVVPAGRVYRAEFDVATSLPDRGTRLAPNTYRSGEFVPVAPGAR